ncbi:MAG: Mobile element protein, partial [Olavius algarvensis Gamma 1 endosymbiont]
SNASGNSSRRKPCTTNTSKRLPNSKPLVRNSSEIRA